jgi:hypothetical protein
VRRPALATVALSLLALLFGWETRQALLATPGRQDNAATAGAWQPGVSAPDPSPPPDPTTQAAAVAARPLFRPDRQPFREQGAGASGRNYEEELSRYTLLGVLDFGGAPYGVVVGKAGSKGERWEVKKGDSLQGFAVKEVGVEGLRLTADGREFLLPLYAGAPRQDATRPASKPVSPPAPAAGSPTLIPGFPAPMPGSAALPRPAAPPASPLSNRLRRAPAMPVAPGASPAPMPSDTPPAMAPGNIPGRR